MSWARNGSWKMPNSTPSPATAMTREEKSAAGLALNRDNFTLERAARAHALCNGARGVAPV